MYVEFKGRQRKVVSGLLVENPTDRPIKLWMEPAPTITVSEPPPPKKVAAGEPND